MKNILVLILVLLVPFSFTMAQDGSLGFTAGVELELPAINNEFTLYATPFIEYDNSLGNLDIWARAGIGLGIIDNNNFPVDLTVEFQPWFNLSLGENSTLSFGIYGGLRFQISPSTDDGFSFGLEPMVKYNQNLTLGDFYGILGLPIDPVIPFKDDASFGLNLTLGWASTFGLGIEFSPHFNILPEGVEFFDSLDFLVSFEINPVYAELVVSISNDIDDGITFSPYFEFGLDKMAFYLGADIAGIGSSADAEINLILGFKYSF